jgi:hypothetical protein
MMARKAFKEKKRKTLHKKLKSETQIRDASKCDRLQSRKMRRTRIIEDQNWLGGG